MGPGRLRSRRRRCKPAVPSASQSRLRRSDEGFVLSNEQTRPSTAGQDAGFAGAPPMGAPFQAILGRPDRACSGHDDSGPGRRSPSPLRGRLRDRDRRTVLRGLPDFQPPRSRSSRRIQRFPRSSKFLLTYMKILIIVRSISSLSTGASRSRGDEPAPAPQSHRGANKFRPTRPTAPPPTRPPPLGVAIARRRARAARRESEPSGSCAFSTS
jgi:hypothetical protein